MVSETYLNRELLHLGLKDIGFLAAEKRASVIVLWCLATYISLLR